MPEPKTGTFSRTSLSQQGPLSRPGTSMGNSNPSLPSSNWLALQKKRLPPSGAMHTRKKRKIEPTEGPTASSSHSTETSFARGQEPVSVVPRAKATPQADRKNGESLNELRSMVMRDLDLSESQKQPGKYLALDCEMVGVGIEGRESSLARVSLVNYYGAVQLDEFVRQKERVVDYRTQYSGVRPSDMVHAKPFSEIQQRVADLLKDRILVGHAVHNDLKALLLSHPHQQTRDTQSCAAKHKLTKSRIPALRHLVQQELNLTIQDGEHSSVTDARATMAIYRLHRREWDKGHGFSSAKRKRTTSISGATDEDVEETEMTSSNTTTTTATTITSTRNANGTSTSHLPSSSSESKKSTSKQKQKQKEGKVSKFPGGGRKGVSSGLSTVIKHKHHHNQAPTGGSGGSRRGSKGSAVDGPSRSAKTTSTSTSSKWWEKLGEGSGGSKGSIRV